MQDLETFYDIDINWGVLVNSVEHNSPAEKAGVQDAGYPAGLERQADQRALSRRDRRRAEIHRGSAHRHGVRSTLKRGKQTCTSPPQPKTARGGRRGERIQIWGIWVREVTRAYANEHSWMTSSAWW